MIHEFFLSVSIFKTDSKCRFIAGLIALDNQLTNLRETYQEFIANRLELNGFALELCCGLHD